MICRRFACHLTTSLMLVALLAACGGDTDTDGTTSPDVTTDAAPVDADDAAADTSGPVDAGGDAADGRDADDGSDTAVDYGRTLADYRSCHFDGDCPVGLGSCIKEVSLNRAESDGNDRVALSSVFTKLDDGQGICTRACTNGESTCRQLSVNGNSPDAEPYVCQIIYAGEKPYPASPPDFPFDEQLDAETLAAGAPFAAICRPPFQLDEQVDRGLCAPCGDGAGQCAGESICWESLTDAATTDDAAGECLAPCQDEAACPLGFACQPLADAEGNALGKVCKPVAGSCTSCVDRDDDGRGTGRCGEANEPITAYDCDDANPDAYYDPDAPNHAFPEFCAPDNDFNCNGLSDADEQIGTDGFGADHCTSCFDACRGAIPKGQKACVQGSCVPTCNDPTKWADCDGDMTNGCEQAVDEPSQLVYRDDDGDGRGRDPDHYSGMGDVKFVCDPSNPPAGYVRDKSDCNDTDDKSYGSGIAGGAATEVCDGADNDCDGVDDLSDDVQGADAVCNTGLEGICADGTKQCQGANGLTCVADEAPVDETCNDLDDDCDGSIDNTDAMGNPPTDGETWYFDEDDDGVGVGSITRKACDDPGANWVKTKGDCEPTDDKIYPGAGENCSTSYDDDCDGRVNDADDVADWLDTKEYFPDSDGDHYSPTPGNQKTGCGGPPMTGWSRADRSAVDCDDQNPVVNPGATEVCDGAGIDEDCDGDTDDAPTGTSTYHLDVDGDGFGSLAADFCSTAPPTNYARGGGDCDESPISRTKPGSGVRYTGADRNPATTETCDGIDNDCDGTIDDGCPKGFRTGGSVQSLTYHGTTYTLDRNIRTCPSGKVLKGFEIKTMERNLGCSEVGVWGLQGICGRLNVTEQRATDPYTYTVKQSGDDYLPSGGEYSGYCNSNYKKTYIYRCKSDTNAVVGISGNATTWGAGRIQRFLFGCKKVTAQTTQLPATKRIGAVKESSEIQPKFQDTSNLGNWFSDECPPGTVAVGYEIRQEQGGLHATRGIALRCQRLDIINRQ